MRTTVALAIASLLLALAVAEEAHAERQRRRDKQKQEETSQAEPAPALAAEPVDPSALGMIIFPAVGQSQEQQSADEAECVQWAESQVGAAAPAASEPEAKTVVPEEESNRERRKDQRTGAALKGAAKGAAAGAVVDEVRENDEPELGDNLGEVRNDFDAPDSRDDVGDNLKKAAHEDDDHDAAKAGAAVGAVAGRRQQTKAQAEAEKQQANAKQGEAEASATNAKEQLKKAIGVCLEAKGYKIG